MYLCCQQEIVQSLGLWGSSKSSAKGADKPPLSLFPWIFSPSFFSITTAVCSWMTSQRHFDLSTKGQQLKIQLVTWVLPKKEYSSDGLYYIYQKHDKWEVWLATPCEGSWGMMIRVFSQLMCWHHCAVSRHCADEDTVAGNFTGTQYTVQKDNFKETTLWTCYVRGRCWADVQTQLKKQ